MSSPQRPLTLGIVAGESSGDNLGAGVMHAITQRYGPCEFVGIGGDNMLAAGLHSLLDISALSMNGFVEPVRRAPELLQLLNSLVTQFKERSIDGFLGVDFNVFNLLLEGRLKRAGFRTAHYVSPSVYAWRRGRVKRIGRAADLLLTLFPFEPVMYKRSSVHAVFVGHPLADEIAPLTTADELENRRVLAALDLGLDARRRTIALLPGSRRSELEQMLELFLAAAVQMHAVHEGTQFVIPCPRPELMEAVQAAVQSAQAACKNLQVSVYSGQGRAALSACHGALIKSGTSSLEAMLLQRPMVVSYRLGTLTYQIVRRMLRTDFVALPNILSGRELVPELLQDAATAQSLAAALLQQLDQPDADLFAEYARLHQTLRCDASAQAARAIGDFLRWSPQSRPDLAVE